MTGFLQLLNNQQAREAALAAGRPWTEKRVSNPDAKNEVKAYLRDLTKAYFEEANPQVSYVGNGNADIHLNSFYIKINDIGEFDHDKFDAFYKDVYQKFGGSVSIESLGNRIDGLKVYGGVFELQQSVRKLDDEAFKELAGSAGRVL